MFTAKEINVIARTLAKMGNKMTLRLTSYGNVVVQHRKAEKVLFAFYKREDGYIIRRRLGYIIRRRLGYDNPFGSGNVLNGGKAIPTIKGTMTYFKNYCEKYPKSIV